MSLQCQGTFLHFVEESGSSRRTQSESPTPKSDASMDWLLCETADTFLWDLELIHFCASACFQFRAWRNEGRRRPHPGRCELYQEAPMSLGSTGHPWFCAPPCVYTFYGKCSRAAWCQYCHLEHPEAKRKLSKSERLLMNSLDESMALSVVLWHIRRQSQKANLYQELRLLLAVIQRRVNLLGGGRVCQKTLAATKTLRALSLGRLFDVIQQSGQVDPDFKKELQDLVQKLRPQLVSRG
ncbi:C3H1-type domain-containing protein [Durusdinium trenchii]|uniref:C3H1-type domain-containing protein n=1 Tax=Durusdinium trenchii TaxID=1381693 RepID=A0ABP0IZY2_9DINO